MIVSANNLKASETLTFNGAAETNGSFRIFSGAGNDSIIGSQNGDEIFGGAGADLVTGGAGGDTFYGGAGADTFIVNDWSHSSYSAVWDRIADFQTGVDKIDQSGMDANSVGGNSNDAFTYIGYSAQFTGVAGQLSIRGPEYTGAANSYAIVADVNGDGVVDLRIDLSSPTAPQFGIFCSRHIALGLHVRFGTFIPMNGPSWLTGD
jgi:hypothetical protein